MKCSVIRRPIGDGIALIHTPIVLVRSSITRDSLSGSFEGMTLRPMSMFEDLPTGRSKCGGVKSTILVVWEPHTSITLIL